MFEERVFCVRRLFFLIKCFILGGYIVGGVWLVDLVRVNRDGMFIFYCNICGGFSDFRVLVIEIVNN